MKKYKIILPFLMTALMLTAAYGQKNTENHLTRVISGVLIKNDFVGNIVEVQSLKLRIKRLIAEGEFANCFFMD